MSGTSTAKVDGDAGIARDSDRSSARDVAATHAHASQNEDKPASEDNK